MSYPVSSAKIRELVLFDSKQHDKSCGVTITHDLGNCDCNKDELVAKIAILLVEARINEWEALLLSSDVEIVRMAEARISELKKGDI